MILALLLGLAFGFISAVPVAGPISALVFTHGMQARYARGRWVAAGAALAESVYTLLAFWGFNQFLADFRYIVPLSNGVAALILGGLGLYFYRGKSLRVPHEAAATAGDATLENPYRAFFMGFSVCVLNPTLIATWTAAITTLYSTRLFNFSPANAVLFSVGVSIGIFAWFTLLLTLLRIHRGKLSAGMIDRGLKGVGILLGALSAWTIYRLVA